MGVRFLAVTAGVVHTCGIKEDGDVECWGLESDPDVIVITSHYICDVGSYPDVDEDGDFNNTVYTLDYGQAVPPSGVRFLAVTTEDTHTCGLNEDGTVKCWGWDRYGQSTPPPGKFRIGGGD